MKVFYGIQGTGNGHITRGRIMARELRDADIAVTYLLTGRPKDQFFDMEIFNDHHWCEGLTFSVRNGKINHIKTVLKSSPFRLIKDIRQLDLSDYDLVISDFEPVTAWAARRQQKKTIGVSHQDAFRYKIPRAGSDPLAETVMKNFAPVDIGIGLHWHHFDQPILPPVIATHDVPQQIQKNKIVVYLPFENQHELIGLLASFKAFEFYIYSPDLALTSHYSHLHCRPLSLHGFQKDLYDCSGIISNAGFELASEALYLGKKILVKPLHAQMEQTSNAAALVELGYGQMMEKVDQGIIEQWLHNTKAVRINYPNTARYLVQWIKNGMPPIDQGWCKQVWSDVTVTPVELP
ncbi:MAG: glycosyltransferase [Burkholderiales bacterium]|nr:glycosyltransferase [Nitrosomonas sp.]MCP5273719.1 glycosyltransferase [Burkholderiales bacterium]MCP5276141.1 glycosyltransferase [Burkholderiales bacterium]